MVICFFHCFRCQPLKKAQEKMIELEGITVPNSIQGCRNVYLYQEKNEWILSTRSQKIATFDHRDDAEEWWRKFEELRGFSYKPVKIFKPTPRVKNRKQREKYVGKKASATAKSYGWAPGKEICPVCAGDGGAAGQCYKCGGSGWA